MLNSESIKGKIRNISKAKNLRTQEVLQMYLFERILDRLEKSDYKYNFIIKGGLLISTMIGIANRTTMDMDTTVKGIELKEEVIERIIKEILGLENQDGIKFELEKITNIRDVDEYDNFRAHIIANYGKVKNPMKIDITTGDVITPKEIEYQYPCMFQNKNIKIMAYPLETIIAEKYETIIKRNISTTRARDFYDLYILYKTRKEELNPTLLKKAIYKTAEKRDSLDEINNWNEIIYDIRNENYLEKIWGNYIEENIYIKNIKFIEVVDVLEDFSKWLYN